MRSTGLLTTEKDIFENKERLESFASVERICATIAHELKNPVNNILLSASALNDMNLNEEQTGFLEMIQRNTNRINNLLTELVEATHLSKLEITNINIANLLDEVLLSASDQVRAAEITVKRNYPEGKRFVSVDPARIKKAFLQLVSNAVEAMEGSKRTLEISIWNEDDSTVIELKDNGTGIPENIQQQIFEPYFTTKQGRRGMGLTLAQTIVLSHGGNLNVLSHPAHGTSILVSLRSTTPL